MVVWPRDNLDEPAIVFRKYLFFVRVLPPKPVADTARGSCSSWTAASREAGCSAVWLLGSASTAHAEAQGGWPASTVLRLLSSAALKRPKPRCAAILAAMRMDG